MAQKKANLIRLKCSLCNRANYYKWRKKGADKKLELKKYCRWCKKHTLHKESRK